MSIMPIAYAVFLFFAVFAVYQVGVITQLVQEQVAFHDKCKNGCPVDAQITADYCHMHDGQLVEVNGQLWCYA